MTRIPCNTNRAFFSRAKDWNRFLFHLKRQHVVRERESSTVLLVYINIRKARSSLTANAGTARGKYGIM